MNIDASINNKKQQGFTLIEALLTLFVLTIGVLGAAGLQMQGLRAGGVAMQRMVAVIKTQDIIERMRANNNILERRNFPAAPVSLAAYAAGSGVDQGCNTGVTCDRALMASNDLYFWRNDLSSALPGFADAVINVGAPPSSAAPVPVTVTITWVDHGDNYSYTVSVDI